jgi:hypothetical protein
LDRVDHRLLPVDHSGRARAETEGGNPHLVINSLDVDEVIALLDMGRQEELADYIAQGVEALVRPAWSRVYRGQHSTLGF